ncbi:MAG TPA: hypothetical protein VKA84_07715 [Gemmatimonadaceae bacterium]|nr:hypothetical protein [Gemmatimonadaceae bacterium]
MTGVTVPDDTAASTLPVLRVEGRPDDALAAGPLGSLDETALLRFLAGRRWFGAKGHTPRSVRVADVIPLRAPGGGPELGAAIARLAVELAEGRVETYQLPLAVRPAGGPAPSAVLARVEASDGGRGVLFDAVEDESFRGMLAEAFAAGGAAFGDGEPSGTRWVVEPVGEGGGEMRGAGASRVGSAEQSNTSIIYGDRAILKLYRRLEEGENPDVEIARFFATKTSFENTPRLLGTIRFEGGAGGSGGSSVAGILQRFLPGSTDCWHYALERSRPYFRAPSNRPVASDFVGDAERLGIVTRAMHDALASDPADPDFAPEPATDDDIAQWTSAVQQAVEGGMALVEAQLAAGRLPADQAGQARHLLSKREVYREHIAERARVLSGHAGARIRHHGDYHLGQVLRAQSGEFMVIDFEGEPARPMAVRRRRHSALRDVAGMLRSFAYAAATLSMEVQQQHDAGRLAQRASRWERGVRDAFLNGYLNSGDPGARAPFLPDEARHIDALISLFETEKVFYELGYELNNRPTWVWIPLRGAVGLLIRGAAV